ncbi:MAG: hypothetical protein ACKE5M_07745 [Methylophilaceae bacterium]
MNQVRFFSVLILFTVGLSGCGGDNSAAIESCVSRGVSYFKEIGSYPTLSSTPNAGRSAEAVARERCNRTTTAF